FIAGQLSRRWLRQWVERNKGLIKWNDQGTIWLVIYTSFSNATANGYWQLLAWHHLLGLIVVCAIFLCITFAATYYSSKWMGFNREDRITIVFCGSKKSLAVGAPMMLAIFGELDNNLLLPLMVFHQVQLMACAHLARIWQQKAQNNA
ncbi:MAG: bile acid:sodium symporter, partial [Akkermansia sp.]|nr:bile acid:sodium symporter [Akkermansia sp.]